MLLPNPQLLQTLPVSRTTNVKVCRYVQNTCMYILSKRALYIWYSCFPPMPHLQTPACVCNHHSKPVRAYMTHMYVYTNLMCVPAHATAAKSFYVCYRDGKPAFVYTYINTYIHTCMSQHIYLHTRHRASIWCAYVHVWHTYVQYMCDTHMSMCPWHTYDTHMSSISHTSCILSHIALLSETCCFNGGPKFWPISGGFRKFCVSKTATNDVSKGNTWHTPTFAGVMFEIK